jgi:hypothetical protein
MAGNKTISLNPITEGKLDSVKDYRIVGHHTTGIPSSSFVVGERLRGRLICCDVSLTWLLSSPGEINWFGHVN